MLKALLATVGIGLLFVVVAARAFGGVIAPEPTPIVPIGGGAPTLPPVTAGPTDTPVPGAPQPDLGPPLIAILAGHSGASPSGVPDPGTVCSNGLEEVTITTAVAERLSQDLQLLGYRTVVLGEWDPRLNGLRATVFLSIHGDSCDYINEEATGFKVSGPEAPRGVPQEHRRLARCLSARYARDTGLLFHENSVSPDMYDYHAFREIDPRVPAAIIEMGFLNLDQRFLLEQQPRVVEGIRDGLLCYMQGQNP